MRKALSVLNDVLATRTFLVGERVTLADITCVCNLLLLYKQVGIAIETHSDYTRSASAFPFFAQYYNCEVVLEIKVGVLPLAISMM